MLKLSRAVRRFEGHERGVSFLSKRNIYFKHGLLDELEERGFISQVTRPEILRHSLENDGSRTVYAGIDPTGQSLHVGHILPMMSLVHFQLRGHNIIPLIGGATARIGDPSGRSSERPQLELARVEDNIAKLNVSVERFFKRALDYATSRLNWYDGLSLLEFLRVAGSQARVNSMIARDSVQSRLNSSQGISFSEFSYQLLQAYDFLTLFRNEGCTIQIGGSDQWGNIVAGIDLISRVSGTLHEDASTEKGFGITTPLLVNSKGEKFGKSAGNAVWLDESMTSIFSFYQFFIRTPDDDVAQLLKNFTLLPLQEIQNIITEHNSRPELRTAQRILADEVTTLVHTANGLRHAREATRVLFDTDFSDVNATDVTAALSGDPCLHRLTSDEVLHVPVARLAVKCGLCASFGAAKQLVASKGLYLNGSPVSIDRKVIQTDVIGEKILIIRAGKTSHAVITIS